jgi:hypothetical protein
MCPNRILRLLPSLSVSLLCLTRILVRAWYSTLRLGKFSPLSAVPGWPGEALLVPTGVVGGALLLADLNLCLLGRPGSVGGLSLNPKGVRTVNRSLGAVVSREVGFRAPTLSPLRGDNLKDPSGPCLNAACLVN